MLLRISLFCIWAACLTFSANAQVSLGASLGANYSFWDWHIKNINTDLGLNPSIGYRAAAVVDWRIGTVLGLRAEMGYQVWRNSLDVSVTSSNGSEDIPGTTHQHFQNWSGSLLASVSPFSGKNFYLLAGPTVAYTASAWYSGDEFLLEPGASATIDIDLANYNRTQVFADFGGGVKFPLGAKGSLFGELRYQLPLTNLSGIDNVDASLSSLLLNVGYLFQL